MLLPRFTIRTGLIVLTAAAVLSVAGRSAVAGEPWAVGVVVALVSVALMLMIHAAVFAVAMLIGRRPPTEGARERAADQPGSAA